MLITMAIQNTMAKYQVVHAFKYFAIKNAACNGII